MRTADIGLLVLACSGLALAQEKVTVPLSNPSQPATVKVHLIRGSITVTAGTAGQVIVEQARREAGRPDRPVPPTPPVPPGMHRIDIDRFGLDVQEDHNVVSIGTGMLMQSSNISIQVPANCSLQLATVSGGHIEVTGVNGEIEASNINGAIDLKNVSGSVVASTTNGSVTATLDRVTHDKPMSFTSLNGKVDVTLPSDTKARLRLKTENGSVFSDFDVKMEPDSAKPIVEDARGQGGKYRIRMDRNIYGSINGGGPEYRFETMNGSILIHKK